MGDVCSCSPYHHHTHQIEFRKPPFPGPQVQREKSVFHIVFTSQDGESLCPLPSLCRGQGWGAAVVPLPLTEQTPTLPLFSPRPLRSGLGFGVHNSFGYFFLLLCALVFLCLSVPPSSSHQFHLRYIQHRPAHSPHSSKRLQRGAVSCSVVVL